MQKAEEIARAIVAREGGFTDDPDDPGEATKHGVTLSTLRRLGIDLNGDGTADLADLHAMTPAAAAAIFLDQYYRRPRIAELPDCLRATVFDMCVNSGANAVKLLQRLLNTAGMDLQVDGLLGARSLSAAHRAAGRGDPVLLRDAYGVARRNYYYALADARPGSRKFARARDGGKGGWIRRAEEFISPRFHLSEDAHRARVREWA